MISNNFDGIFGIGIFPVISMLIFIVLFVWLIIWVVKKDKKYINKMKNLPVDEKTEGDES